MALQKQFENHLDEIWHRWTDSLRSRVRSRRGARKTFSRQHREKCIERLSGTAETFFVKRDAKNSWRCLVVAQRRVLLNQRGVSRKHQRLMELIDTLRDGPIIYTFWRGKTCLYVGKSRSTSRLKSYRRSTILDKATRCCVFSIRAQSFLEQAECLAIHLWNPKQNEYRAAERHYSKKCPICKEVKQITRELRDLFRLR